MCVQPSPGRPSEVWEVAVHGKTVKEMGGQGGLRNIVGTAVLCNARCKDE